MNKNVGQIDKIIRIIAGLLLIILPLTGTVGTMGLWSWIAILVGVVFLGTGFMGTCPAYKLLGMNTCSTTHKSQT